MIDLETLKDYLIRLNQDKKYLSYLKYIDKKDNLTNIKNFFNKYIFISIIDFKEGNYDKLFFTKKDLKKYIKKNPYKTCDKQIIKKEEIYRIFLRQVVY